MRSERCQRPSPTLATKDYTAVRGLLLPLELAQEFERLVLTDERSGHLPPTRRLMTPTHDNVTY